MEQQFRKLKAKAVRVKAVDAVLDLPRYDIEMSWRCSFTTDKEYACTLSHLVAIAKAYQDGVDFALIMEDDMKILRLPSIKLLSIAPADWEILQLSASGRAVSQLYTNPKQYFVPWRSSYINTGGYLINRRGMVHILAKMAPDALKRSDLKTVSFKEAKLRFQPLPHFKGCNADYILYDLVNTYTCCDLSMYEDRKYNSTIQSDGHLKRLQDASARFIESLFKERGFLMAW